MKKRKILYLFPLAALVLSGCTFQEGWETAKTWMSDHIFTPIANLFNGGSKDSGKKPSGGNTPAPSTDSDTEEVVATEVGSVDNPLTVSAFHTLCEENLASSYAGIETGKSVTDFAHIAYLKAKVSSNTWNKEGTKIQYLNLVDQNNSSLQVTGMFVVVDESVKGDYSAKDSLKGLEVVVKGYPALYNKNGTKTYELVSKDKSDSENPRLMKVFAPEPTPGVNYGTADAPLTVTQAKALIDTESPTKVRAYVTGTVKSNEAWNADKKNVFKIFLTDGENDLYLFQCATFPSDVAKESITANSLRGKTIVASGIGEKYNSDYEFTSPQVLSLTGEDIPPVVIDNYGTLESPLSITEAIGVVDAEGTSKQTVYVTGEVKSNIAWDESHGNIDIVLTDGEHDFKLFRASTLPNGIKPAADELVGKTIVAHGSATLYGSTYELAQNCVVDSITDAAPVEVEYVQLSSYEVSMEVDEHVTLTGSVHPEKASQELEWEISQEGDVVSFENGVITGLSVGSATITATSVADPTKSASCTVTVSEKTKILTGIEINTENAIKEYNVGDDFSAEGLVVTAKYSNAADEDVTEFVTWDIDPASAEAEGEQSVSFTANYNEESSTAVVSVTVSAAPAEKGSEGNPYTCAEARDAIDNGGNVTGVYAKGIVTKIAKAYGNGSMSFYFSDDGGKTNDLEAYNLAAESDPNIEVGDEVIVKGNLKKYSSTYEFDTGCTLEGHIKPTTVAVTLEGTPKAEYEQGENVGNTGLVATAELSNGIFANVTATATWTYNGEETLAAVDGAKVTITATYGGQSASVEVTLSVSAPSVNYVSIGSLSFDKNQNVQVTTGTKKVTYVENNVNIEVAQGTSSSAVNVWKADYSSCRWYKSHVVTITGAENFAKVVITFSTESSNQYVPAEGENYGTGITLSMNGAVGTFTVEANAASMALTMAKQLRVISVELFKIA